MRRNSILTFALTAMLVAVATLLGAPPLFVAGATTTAFGDLDAAMKVVFDDALVNNVVSDTELSDLIPDGKGIKLDRTTGGRYIETAQMFALPAGVGARGPGDYIPIPGGPTIKNGRVDLKKIMGSVECDAESLTIVRTDEAAFLDWSERQMPSLVERLVNEMDRMLLGFGSGIKARVNAAVPATTLILDSPCGVAGFNRAPLQFLPGESIRAASGADGSGLRTGVMKVLAHDHDNEAIVVDTLADALADDDWIFAGDAAGNSLGKETMGLFGMVDDGDILNVFQNIPRDLYPLFKSYVKDANGAVLTEDLCAEVDDEALIRGGAKVDTIITSAYAHRAIWKDLRGDRSINDPRSMMEGGQTRIRMRFLSRVVTMQTARKLPDKVVFGLQINTFRKWLHRKWQWDDTTGSLWNQVVDSTGRKHAFYAFGWLRCEYGNRDPQKNWRLDNFIAPAEAE